MKILYFTGTGNSLYIAKQFGGEVISIAQGLENNIKEYTDSEAIGLVFPTYGHSIPKIVTEFIQKVKLKSPYIFAVMTAGSGVGDALSYLSRLAEKSDNQIDYGNYIIMSSNHIPKVNLEKESRIDKHVEEQIKRIVSDIKEKKTYVFAGTKKDIIVRHLISAVHQIYKDDCNRYSVSDTCIGCGICIKVCPRENIKITKKQPQFGGICEGCQACLHACPKKAIQICRDKNPGIRYRNDKIKLQELFLR